MTFRERITKAMENYTNIAVPEGDHTVGALISAVMEIDDEAEAQEFWRGYVDYITIAYPERPSEPVCRSNIGWCFGEGMSNERKEMWIKVSGASHPVFGQMKPTTEEAFQAGIEAGKALSDN